MGASPSLGWAWATLVVAGVLEVVWSTSMKASNGYSHAGYTAVTFVVAWLSFGLLGWAMKVLPLGIAYAVWTGIGAVGAALVGMIWFNEPVSLARLACVSAIVGGIIGLKVLSDAG